MVLLAACIASATLLASFQGPAEPLSGASQGSEGLPPSTHVALNHLYVVLDEETFTAIRSSRFLTERFASVDTGLPDFAPVTDESASLYVRGEDTYLELLGPGNRFGAPVGKVGIGLGVDEGRHLDDVERAWNERLGGGVIRQKLEWARDGANVPWYEALLHPDTLADPHLAVWASAYRPEFLPWLYPERTKDENGVRRADFLAPRFAPDRLLENVTGLTLALPGNLRIQIARQLEAVGYAREEQEGCLRLVGRDWSLTLVEPKRDRTAILGIQFITTREYRGPPVIRLGGRSVFTLGPGRTGTWAFL